MDFELEEIKRESTEELHVDTTTPPISGGTGEALRATICLQVLLKDSVAPDRVIVTYSNDPKNDGETTTFASDAT